MNTMPPVQRRSLLNYVGVGVLIFGMIAGELIYWHGLRNPPPDYGPDWQTNTAVYEQTIERTVGDWGVVYDKIQRGLASLAAPRPLAIIICVASMIAAGGCFLFASRLPRE
jgi:hypothetical protein